jgi:hypothetical protein
LRPDLTSSDGGAALTGSQAGIVRRGFAVGSNINGLMKNCRDKSFRRTAEDLVAGLGLNIR